jgi:hypothetical protein
MASVNRSQVLLVSVLGLLALGTLIGAHLMSNDNVAERNDFDFSAERKSLHNLLVTVPVQMREPYLRRMKEFAIANELKFRIGHSVKDVLFLDLWRPDVILTGGNVFEPSEFQFHEYIDPAKGGSEDRASALVDRMKEALADMPGITVTEVK